jgi:hypothetical protein
MSRISGTIVGLDEQLKRNKAANRRNDSLAVSEARKLGIKPPAVGQVYYYWTLPMNGTQTYRKIKVVQRRRSDFDVKLVFYSVMLGGVEKITPVELHTWLRGRRERTILTESDFNALPEGEAIVVE